MKHNFLHYHVFKGDEKIYVAERDACKVRSKDGFIGWLQRIAIRFLRKTNAITPARFEYRPQFETQEVTINIEKLIESLVDYMNSIEHSFNIRPEKILVGMDIWNYIVSTKRHDPHYTMVFHLNHHRPIQKGYDHIEFFGIPMHYTPWINGVVFVPPTN